MEELEFEELFVEVELEEELLEFVKGLALALGKSGFDLGVGGDAAVDVVVVVDVVAATKGATGRYAIELEVIFSAGLILVTAGVAGEVVVAVVAVVEEGVGRELFD